MNAVIYARFSPAKKSCSSEQDFFIHCESNGISSPQGAFHQPSGCISPRAACIFRNDDIQSFALIKYNSSGMKQIISYTKCLPHCCDRPKIC